ncbi:MAG: cadmium-translocating P-type ATPase [Clostridia bacterium]|nr:cadmium-translocating P-type ATPase [Clostridia bacterium]
MRRFEVTGMACAACSAKVESTVSSLKGVSSCSVNLLTNSMTVEGDTPSDEIIEAVRYAGFGAKLIDGTADRKRDDTAEKETKILAKRLIVSALLLAALMYFSMGKMLHLPLPSNEIISGIIQGVLSLVILAVNRKFFISGVKGVIHLSPNMDTLVALGSGISFAYSTAVLISLAAGKPSGDLYFDSAAMIPAFVTVGKLLETRSKGKTAQAINGLIDLTPKYANVIRNGTETSIPASEIVKDDIFIVRAGETFAADGSIEEGSGYVDESALTGEGVPVYKEKDSSVYGGTILRDGYVRCRADEVGANTVLSRIIDLAQETGATKAPIAKTADKVAAVFVPAVMCIALAVFLVWTFIVKSDIETALRHAICVLVISCPCAMGLATPVAVTVGSGAGARQGILFRSAAVLEETGRAEIVVLDKTGTVTLGKPFVTDVTVTENTDENEMLKYVCSLESMSSHPISEAAVSYCRERGIKAEKVTDFVNIPGKGVEGRVDDKIIRMGNYKFITVGDEFNKESIEKLTQEGKTVIFVAADEKPMGVIAVADKIKDDSTEAVSEMKNMGLRVVMLTGDNGKTAAAIGRQTGIDEIISDVLPDEKEKHIRLLREKGKTVMVGDGINDAPALMRADVGMAIGSGTDIAIDSSDAVLLNSRLSDVVKALKLGRAVLRNIKQNLFWAFFYNIIAITVAAGIFSPFGIELKPAFGALAMSLSSFCVVSNALRLSRFGKGKKG